MGLGAACGAALIIAASLWLGRGWWNRVDSDYRNNRMYKPVPLDASLRNNGALRVLQLEIRSAEGAGTTWAPLVPDHGKLMHAFLIREPELDAFAHLHPVRRTSTNFVSVLPPLPAGRYRCYADVTHETGLSRTLTAVVDLPEANAKRWDKDF